MADKEDLERMWADEKNWTAIGVYNCPADPRLVVPKRVKALGWTINAAHSSSFFLLFIVGGLALVPPLYVVFKIGPSFTNMLAALALSAAIVCGTCGYFASRK